MPGVPAERESGSMIDWPEKERYTAEDLVEIIRILRRPEGCPWDKVQTHQSIRKNFLEETCEVLEAIDADDPRMLREELGRSEERRVGKEGRRRSGESRSRERQ